MVIFVSIETIYAQDGVAHASVAWVTTGDPPVPGRCEVLLDPAALDSAAVMAALLVGVAAQLTLDLGVAVSVLDLRLVS